MKKYLFILLLIVSAGILLAVESAPSATVGYVKYPSVPGLNFAAMPMDDGMTLTSEVGAYMGPNDEIDTINLWDNASQTWLGSTNYGGGFWDPDLSVGPGSVLYYYSSVAFDYYSIGALPATNAQYNIVPGLNTVMVPLNKSNLTLASEAGVDIGPNDEIDTINLWDNASQTWFGCTNYGGGFWDPDFGVSIGTPLYIYSNSAITWPAGPRGAVKTSSARSK
ncbi:MAG TPA: hypothetical protein PLF50_02185 [Candidatus Cloacimonadota bacterium]|nr:hypothetical protein [Candidatus Cloacimonadota bacterium]